MDEIHIYKAQDAIQSNPVYSVSIVIDRPFPALTSIESCDSLFASDAQKLARDLINKLPGGTLDRLFLELCKYKAGHLVVAGPAQKPDLLNDVRRQRDDIADALARERALNTSLEARVRAMKETIAVLLSL